MKELKEKTASIQEEIDSLQEEIMGVGGMDLRLQKIVVDNVRKSIDGHNDKITKCSVHKAKAEKDVVKLGANIEKSTKDMELMLQESAELDRQVIAITTTCASIQGELDDMKKVSMKKARIISWLTLSLS